MAKKLRIDDAEVNKGKSVLDIDWNAAESVGTLDFETEED